MFDLIHVAGNTYYIENPARIGVYVIDKNVWLVDGGFAPDAGVRILDVITKQGWTLKGIIVTHAHPDHVGGCRYLQSKTNCKIFAHGVEVALTQFPVLHPSFTYGGRPYRVLRGKSNMAEPCSVCEMEGKIPSELQLILLRGHSFDMVGIRTPDDIVFLADALCAENVLAHYGITFVYDVGAYLDTLDMLFSLKAKIFIPSHVPPANDIRKLVQLNKKSVFSVAYTIASWCVPQATNEMLLQKVFKQYRHSINFDQYGLVGSTMRSYLAWLKDTGRVETEFKDNILYWKKS